MFQDLALAIVNIFNHYRSIHQHHTDSVIKCDNFSFHINFIFGVLIDYISVNKKEIEPERDNVRFISIFWHCWDVLACLLT